MPFTELGLTDMRDALQDFARAEHTCAVCGLRDAHVQHHAMMQPAHTSERECLQAMRRRHAILQQRLHAIALQLHGFRGMRSHMGDLKMDDIRHDLHTLQELGR